MSKLSRTQVLLTSVAVGVSGLWFYRNWKFNRYLDLTRERVAKSTGADKPMALANLSTCLEPIKIIYDRGDKQLSYKKLKTFVNVLKAALIEFVDENEDRLECAEVSTNKCSLLICRRESLSRQMARVVARDTGGICFVFIYPDKPKTVLERLDSIRQYVSGQPEWLDNFASSGILLSSWMCSLGQSVCPLKGTKSPLIHPDDIPLLVTKTTMRKGKKI